jgi:EAL domain-containing protein (putative c-di-GMP-specific phosphodiesterase class I)
MEESGMIVPLGKWILRTACAQAKSWLDQGHDLNVSVNLSARQFKGQDFARVAKETLQSVGLEGKYLELELTESILIEAGAETQAKLAELRDMKIRMTIDDFGTGYSSLSYLKRFPVDKLKVDQSFIRGIPGDLADEQITSAIIAMAKSLDLEVVAEGIESDEQFNFLNALGCHTGQGFLFSQAVPAGVATQLIRMLHHGQRPEDGDALVFPQLWG